MSHKIINSVYLAFMKTVQGIQGLFLRVLFLMIFAAIFSCIYWHRVWRQGGRALVDTNSVWGGVLFSDRVERTADWANWVIPGRFPQGSQLTRWYFRVVVTQVLDSYRPSKSLKHHLLISLWAETSIVDTQRVNPYQNIFFSFILILCINAVVWINFYYSDNLFLKDRHFSTWIEIGG